MEAELRVSAYHQEGGADGSMEVHVDNKGIIDGEEKEKCIYPKAGDADLLIKILGRVHICLTSKEILVSKSKAHRTKKVKKVMPAL